MEEQEKKILQECKIQLEYLNEKFGETGTTNALLPKINNALSLPPKVEPKELSEEEKDRIISLVHTTLGFYIDGESTEETYHNLSCLFTQENKPKKE
jgi:hypothetical protein